MHGPLFHHYITENIIASRDNEIVIFCLCILIKHFLKLYLTVNSKYNNNNISNIIVFINHILLIVCIINYVPNLSKNKHLKI